MKKCLSFGLVFLSIFLSGSIFAGCPNNFPNFNKLVLELKSIIKLADVSTSKRLELQNSLILFLREIDTRENDLLSRFNKSHISNFYWHPKKLNRIKKLKKELNSKFKSLKDYDKFNSLFNSLFARLISLNLYGNNISSEQIHCMSINDATRATDSSINSEITLKTFYDLMTLELARFSLFTEVYDVSSMVDKVVMEEELLWRDTILEGDFFQVGTAKALVIITILYRKSLLGYKIYIAAPAILATYGQNSCVYNEETYSFKGDCTEGNFSVFRTTDPFGRFIGPEDYVEFE